LLKNPKIIRRKKMKKDMILEYEKIREYLISVEKEREKERNKSMRKERRKKKKMMPHPF